jgi:hypothetical protein
LIEPHAQWVAGEILATRLELDGVDDPDAASTIAVDGRQLRVTVVKI